MAFEAQVNNSENEYIIREYEIINRFYSSTI